MEDFLKRLKTGGLFFWFTRDKFHSLNTESMWNKFYDVHVNQQIITKEILILQEY